MYREWWHLFEQQLRIVLPIDRDKADFQYDYIITSKAKVTVTAANFELPYCLSLYLTVASHSPQPNRKPGQLHGFRQYFTLPHIVRVDSEWTPSCPRTVLGQSEQS